MIKVNTGVAEIIIHKIRKGTKLIDVPDGAKSGIVFGKFPEETDWIPVGVSNDLTEEQCAGIVKRFFDGYYWDYEWHYYHLKTAKESFKSLLESIGSSPCESYFIGKKQK